MSILVVEDNERNLYLLQALLTANGYRVVTACNGAEALAEARREPPDLVVSDIVMPVMDGFALCREWKKDERLRSIPFVFYTASLTDAQDRELARSLGAERFLVKPMQSAVLLREIREMLDRARCPAAPASSAAPSAEQSADESVYLRQYSKVLVHKLETKVVQCREAGEKLRHLTRVLRAVRSIDRLTVHEKDRGKLLQRACDVLVETCGYGGVFISLSGPPPLFFGSFPRAGEDPYREVAERLRGGGSVPCVARAAASSAVVVMEASRGDCSGCPMAKACRESKALAVGLEREGRTFGALSAAPTDKNVPDEEERTLLKELADDLAYALKAIEEEERLDEAEAQADWLAAFSRESPHPQLRVGLDGVLLYANKATAPLLDAWHCEVGACLPEALWEPLNAASKRREAGETEETFGGRTWLFTWVPIPDAGYVNIYARDITSRKGEELALRSRLELLEFAASHSLDETLRIMLDLAEELSGSLIGSCHFVAGDQKNLHLQSWSTRTLREFCKAEGEGTHYPIEQAGVWADCVAARKPVIHNDYASLPHRKGMPEGHGVVERELVVPVLRGGKPVAVLGVGNKPAPYTEADAEIVGRFADVAWDVVERKRAEEENARLEKQLRQAQKMEAIGQLAGGVAHDFNNLLFVMDGRIDMALHELGPDDPVRRHLELARAAAERAAALTRQLLAFSRRQLLQPKVIDVNAVVANLAAILQRLVREDIAVSTALDPALRCTRADPGQIEQLLMNLAVNARDAMPQGGSLTIETRNAEMDERFCRLHEGARPGQYVALAVRDTGAGMNSEVKAHLFEPFFTTKGLGRGTGLGLATVYGIVKQSGGYIDVESEPGKGSLFTIYLPRVDETVAPERALEPVPHARRAGETVLLVEDMDPVRDVVREMLERLGYRVLAAGNGEEALALAEEHSGPLHVLLSDVVMPGMSGPELARRLRERRPETLVLLMSGHTDADLVGPDGLNGDTRYIQKPITAEELSQKLGRLLGREGHSTAGSAK